MAAQARVRVIGMVKHEHSNDLQGKERAGARQRQSTREDESAYVLHAYAFKETSLVVEIFSRNCGRIGLVARGARRPHSTMRGLLMAFQPLSLSWGGKSELRTLYRAETVTGHVQLSGLSLLCGFYLNELVLKLLPREDAHENLYDAYEYALAQLRGEAPPAWALRRFEKQLLRELGYGLVLDRDIEGAPIEVERRYTYILEAGPRPLLEAERDVPLELSGSTLLELAADDYRRPGTLQESRALMRYVLGHYLGGQELHTRQLLREMQQL
jgi:DNA repair protein RecO (recombination protein O)